MATDANSPISTNYSVGINNVGSYQVAGAPWVTGAVMHASQHSGSIITYKFPMVAKKIVVKVIPPGFIGGSGVSNITASSAIHVSFGAPSDGAGNLRQGLNSFNSIGEGFTGSHPNPPQQILGNHYYTLQYVSGTTMAGVPLINYGQEMTFDVKSTHVNIATIGSLAGGVTGSFQIYAELTNIPIARMWEPSGSGINITL